MGGDVAGSPVMALYSEAESNYEQHEMQDWYEATIKKLLRAMRRREDRQILDRWDAWVQTLHTDAVKEVRAGSHSAAHVFIYILSYAYFSEIYNRHVTLPIFRQSI